MRLTREEGGTICEESRMKWEEGGMNVGGGWDECGRKMRGK